MKAQTKWIIALAVVVGGVTAGYFAATRALDHFLANGALTRLIGEKTAVKLGADTGYLPLTQAGLFIRSDGILVRGKPPRALAEMSAVDLRAYCSLQDLWRRKWTITRLEASHLQAAFGRAAAERLQRILPTNPSLQPQIDTPSPLKVDIRETFIQRTDFFWGETPQKLGYLRNVAAWFYPKERGFDAIGGGGTFWQTGWPEVKVDALSLHYGRPKLEVQSATFLLGQKGKIAVTGGLDFDDGGAMRLALQGSALPVRPFLSGYWNDKLEGILDSNCRIEKTSASPVTGEGEVNFGQASVHDVPTLKQIALVTRHPQFEKPKIDILRGHYDWSGSRLAVTNLEIESKGLFRIEGKFVIENETIDGRFRIGSTPEVLESIPGAREKVFTESRGGYLWSSLTLSGPVHNPREDLKQRLVAAAEEHFAGEFLAPIVKPGKAVLEMLNAINK